MQTAQRDSEAEPGLQRFALAIYRAEGVSTACLLLQARADLDVNLVLFAAFFGARGRTLTAAHVAEVGERIDAWHAEVVRPLRGVRQRLKSGPAPAPNERTAALRSALQKLEIEAELIELAEVDALGDTLDAEPAVGDTAARVAAAIDVVVRAKIGREQDGDEREAVTRIADAAAVFVDERLG